MSTALDNSARVSVVIGTLNRAEAIGRSIQSLLDQDFPAANYEIIVVDNGCTDGTAAIVQGVCQQHSNVRYVTEPRLGLSNARNKGISEARYELVAFFDDDATAEPGWFTALVEIFRRHPDVGAAGGPIYVGWPEARPKWMPTSCEGYFGHCYHGAERHLLEFPRYPFGSNMVIRKEKLLAVGGFRDNVGPKGQNAMSAGEQDLFSRLYKLPTKVMWEPTAVVYHWIQADRVNRKWVSRRAFKHGFSNTRMLSNDADRDARGLAVRAIGRTAIGFASAAVGWLVRKDSATVMSRFTNAMYWAGVSRGSIRL